jgi:hypothetical protein
MHKFSLKNIFREIKFCWQRITRGFDDGETWSLDKTLARLILPRLKRFKEVSITYPAHLSPEVWEQYLAHMIAAFEILASEETYLTMSDDDLKKIKSGLWLFHEHYLDLWW